MAIETLTKRIQFKQSIPISKFRFWSGFTVSVLVSFFLYQFFIFGRDLLRLFTLSDNFNYLDFSENELLFYNLFYAFLALIIGQSFFLKIVFDTNKTFGEKRIQFKRKKIVHNQNVWIWFFLLWFFRFATMYSFLNMVGFGQKVNYAPVFYEYFSFYEEYPYLFVLIVLVLFLQSWQGLGLTIRNYFKYLMSSFLLISVLAFGFSRINLVDFESYFKEKHSQNPYIKGNIHLPKVHFTESLSLRHKKKEFFITKDLKIIYNNQELDSIAFLINILEKDKYPQYGLFKPFIQLNVDKNVPMKKVYDIKNIIYANSDYEIAFATYPINMKLNEAVYQEHAVGLFENPRYAPFFDVDKVSPREYFKTAFLRLSNENEILIKNIIVPENEIANIITNRLAKDEYFPITIELKEDALFSDYMKVLSYARQGYLKACQIVGKEKGVDEFTLKYFPYEILNFNLIDFDEPEIKNSLDYMDDLPF